MLCRRYCSAGRLVVPHRAYKNLNLSRAHFTSTMTAPIFELPIPRRKADQFSLNPTTGGLRKLHIRRLYDLLHLSLLRRDLVRASKCWKILVRCREIDFGQLWHLGLRVLFSSDQSEPEDDGEVHSSVLSKCLTYLKGCQNLDPKEVRSNNSLRSTFLSR